MHREAAGQNCACGIAGPVVWGSEIRERVSNRVVGEDASCSRRLAGCGTAYAIDLWRATNSEHAASHVINLVVREGGCLCTPGIGRSVILEWVREIAAGCIGGAPAHGVEVPIAREKHADVADTDDWE